MHEKLIEREREYKLQLWIPFSSDRKMMTVAYTTSDAPEYVRLVTKGAPENIVSRCRNKINQLAEPVPFHGNGHEGEQYL